ncbi:MAG: hypothetical protein COA42_18835 [Alteromonadaceae bacterium]|nr:MAG: hypothetical protein COA42_18835 [Alteromonadaceae bacterium]
MNLGGNWLEGVSMGELSLVALVGLSAIFVFLGEMALGMCASVNQRSFEHQVDAPAMPPYNTYRIMYM